MDKAVEKVSSSLKLRIIILYVAIIATVAVFSVGYNQYSTCTIQKSNVENTLARNAALDTVIERQVALYTAAKGIPEISDGLRHEFNRSIRILEDSRNIIKDTPPKKVRCVIPFGSVKSVGK